MHCSARVSLDPSALGKVADEVTEKFGRGTPEQTAAAAGWLNRHQLFAQARDLLLPEAALKDARLFNLRFAALMGLKDARGAYDFIKSDKAPGDPLQVEMLRCGTALQLKDQALIDAHFHALIELGKRNGRSLRMVAEYAIRVGQRPAAIEAYKLLQKNPRDAATAIQGLMRLTDRAGKTWEARDYARALAKLRKDDDSVKLQLAYYDVLLKENLEEASGILEKLHLSKPEDFNRRVTLALAHLRQNKPKEAFNLLEGQMVSWNRTVPGLRAIVAATFDANGRRSVASNLVSRMPLGLLKPEERELLRPIVGSAALSTNAPDATPVIENPVEK